MPYEMEAGKVNRNIHFIGLKHKFNNVLENKLLKRRI